VVYGAEPGSKETIWLLEWSPSGKSLACGTFDADADEFNFFALDFE
jgi:hypothetical protein